MATTYTTSKITTMCILIYFFPGFFSMYIQVFCFKTRIMSYKVHYP